MPHMTTDNHGDTHTVVRKTIDSSRTNAKITETIFFIFLSPSTFLIFNQHQTSAYRTEFVPGIYGVN